MIRSILRALRQMLGSVLYTPSIICIDIANIGLERGARATALVSDPPLPRVVTLFSASTPWKPATTTLRSLLEFIPDGGRLHLQDAGLFEGLICPDPNLKTEEGFVWAAHAVET